jgi:hypothetical protein
MKVMADNLIASDVVTRTGGDASAKAALRHRRSPASKGGQAAMWTALIVASALTLIPIGRYAGQEIETWRLRESNEAGVRDAIAGDWMHSASADYVETISELSLNLPKADAETAYAAAQRATQLDASRSHAWATLAWLQYSKAKKVTPAVLDALTKSMDACPMCDQGLIRWRFNFVLANWSAMPEPLRTRAFEQADLLRWIGNNHLFLADMGIKAGQAGIAFDKYRMAVKTPVRTLDLGLAPEAPAASASVPQTVPAVPAVAPALTPPVTPGG